MLLAGVRCSGQVYALNDNNSYALVDVGSARGMYAWDIDRLNVLNQQGFWFRTAATGVALPINTISPAAVTLPYGPGGRGLSVAYINSGVNVRVDYLLSGGALLTSGQSDITESITVNNTGTQAMVFDLFEYADFDLSFGSDTVLLGRNMRGLYNEAFQTASWLNISETVASRGADYGEAAVIGATLGEMNNPGFANLNDNAGPVGPADVTWALEWDLNIDPGSSAIIATDNFVALTLIPEPSTLALGGCALAIWWWRRPRRPAVPTLRAIP